jgi:hypothetical protein
MKKFGIWLLTIGVLSVMMSSCTIRQKAVPITPVNAQINIDYDDLEYLGDITGSSSQSYVLGIIPYGGRKYHRGTLSLLGLGVGIPGNRGYNNALYDALMQKPNADFVLPVSFETITHQQFLGRRVELSIRCKAYRIKTK